MNLAHLLGSEILFIACAGIIISFCGSLWTQLVAVSPDVRNLQAPNPRRGTMIMCASCDAYPMHVW